MKLYRIANWDDHFETYETKKLTYLKWVPVPNKHDGLGYRRIVAQKNRCELFTAWNLILQVASKGRKGGERGVLKRQGKPLSAEDLAIMTGFPTDIFEKALPFFSSAQMGWLAVEEQAHTEKTGGPAGKTADAAEETGGPAAEGKGREGNEGNGLEGTEGKPEAEPPPTSDEDWLNGLLADLAYQGIDVLREYRKMLHWCQANKKHATRRRFISWLNRVERPIIGGVFPDHRSEKASKEFPEVVKAKQIFPGQGNF